MLPSPEPSISANVYCAGHLDEVIYGCITPFWQEARSVQRERVGLRLLRYPRGGDHVKIRIHGPKAQSPALERSFEAAVKSFLEGMTAERIERAPGTIAEAPPIDVEDEMPGNHPDLSLVWTRYRRSHIEFGGAPFLDDDAYISRMVHCQAEATERVLAVLAPDRAGIVPFRVRQNTLLKAVISAIAVLPWSPERRRVYFAYHRDWLVRFFFARRGEGPEKATEMMARLDDNVLRLGTGLDVYRKVAEAQWKRAGERPEPAAADTPWRAAIEGLFDYVTPFADEPGYLSDPFAAEPMFPALFKVLHALANQLGLKPSDEAFAYHLLLRAAGGGDDYGFTHDPPSR